MLKLKAALVSLVLGSSSVALASPGVTFTAGAQAAFSFGPEVRDHRTPTPYAMPQRTSWIQLSSPSSLRKGRAVIRPELARISQLRLQASRGMTYVQRVELRFHDGTSQKLQVNRWLTSTIDLTVRNGRAVDSITIIGSANRSATYQLFAQGSRFEAPLPPVYEPPVYQPQPPIYQPQPPIYQPQPPIYQPQPIQASPAFTLGQNMTFSGTNGSRVMMVGAIKGVFNTLRLEGAGSGAFIQMVKIYFADGTTQFHDAVNKSLAPAEVYDVVLDGINPRAVDHVEVWTSGSRPINMFSAALL